jgi:hypothetical protein
MKGPPLTGSHAPPSPPPTPYPPFVPCAPQLTIIPSCATSGGVCPLPAAPWQTTWQLNRSTICQVGSLLFARFVVCCSQLLPTSHHPLARSDT